MDKIKISTAQFEHKNADKAYNLSIIEKLSQKAASEGSNVIAFHECSITGYTFARGLSKKQMLDLAESVPGGPGIKRLIEISQQYDLTILAGLFEKDNEDKLYNTYVCVDKNGLVAKHRKL